LNIDHQRTYEAVLTALRPLHERLPPLITFETPSSTEWADPHHFGHFSPNIFVRLSEKHISAKTSAMACYHYEKRSFPHPRSEEALRIIARRWGSVAGCSYAEPFRLIRAVLS